MSKGKKKFKFGALADFIKAAFEGEVPREEVEKIIANIRMGVGLQKRDRELAKFMEQAPPSFEDDPIFVKGFAVGYAQAVTDLDAGVDVHAIVTDEPANDNAQPDEAKKAN